MFIEKSVPKNRLSRQQGWKADIELSAFLHLSLADCMTTDKSCHIVSISITINIIVIVVLPNYLTGLSLGANKVIYKSAFLNHCS